MSPTSSNLKKKLSILLPALNEKQRRLLVGAEALSIGYGGIKLLSEITGMNPRTIRRGIQEIRVGDTDVERVRSPGGGRKKLGLEAPELYDLIEQLVEPDTRGDPEAPLRWTCKSVRNFVDLLQAHGYHIGRQSVANILHEMEFSLQGNCKTKEGEDHPDRDQQFRFISRTTKTFLAHHAPAISVDTKKKELVGSYHNAGKEWHAKGSPIKVNTHDFPDPKVPKAIPYGIYDLAEDSGWVHVGVTSDTAEFAVSSIRHWWQYVGSRRYPPSAKTAHLCGCGRQ